MLRSHFIAITLAVVVGVISVAPQIYVFFDSHYRGIQMFGTDAEYDYVAKVNKSAYADYSYGPFPPDPGKNYYLAPQLGERFMAFVGWVTHTSAVEVNVLFKFFAPAVLFLIMYAWLLEMLGSRAIAVIAPLFVIFGINLLDPRECIRLFSLKTSITSFLPYTRPISPQISSIFLFASLWGMYRYLYTERPLRYMPVALLGVFIGISLYSYIYTWTFLMVVLAVWFVWFLYQRNMAKVKLVIMVMLTSMFVAIPFFLNMLHARGDADYINTSARIGLIHTHAPVLGAWIVIGFILLIFFWPKNEYKNVRQFFFLIFASLILVLNQQIVTGLKLQPGHYHWYITKPFIAVLLTCLGFYWLKRVLYWVGKMLRKPNQMRAAVALMAAVFIGEAIIIQRTSYLANYAEYVQNQHYASLFKYLNDHFTTEENIWAEQHLSTLLLAYTRYNAPDNFHAQFYVDSREHLRDMLFLEYRFRGITSQAIYDQLNKDKEDVTSRIYGIYYRDLPTGQQLSDKDIRTLAAAYEVFSRQSLDDILKKFHIDVVVEKTKNEYRGWFTFMSKVNLENNIAVYWLHTTK